MNRSIRRIEKREIEAAQADYPPGFKPWAFWQIDLSLHAPSLDKQLAKLLAEWQQKFGAPTNAD